MKLNWLLILLIYQGCLLGQSLSTTTSFDTLYLGNTLTLTYTAKNLPGSIQVDVSDLPIISGPNQSSSSIYTNGELETVHSISYILRPEVAGIVDMPEAYVRDGDQVYETTLHTVIVLDNPDNIIQHPKKEGLRSIFGNDFFRTVPDLPRSSSKRRRSRRQLKKI